MVPKNADTASPANPVIFAFFLSYAVYFLIAYGNRLNYEYLYDNMRAFTAGKEPWIVVSYFAAVLYMLWVSFNCFRVKTPARAGLTAVFLSAICLRLVPAMITFGASTDMKTFEFVQSSAMSGDWKAFMEHAPYLPFYSYILHLLGVINSRLHMPAYFVIKLVPVIFDSLMIFPVYALSGSRERAETYAWNPVTIMTGAVHGQFDSMTMFFVLIALYYSVKKTRAFAAGLSFGAAFQSKWWPLMLAPAFFLRMKTKAMIVFAASWLAVFLLFSLHYMRLGPGLMLRPFDYLGIPQDYGITGFVHYITAHLLHLNAAIYKPAVLFVTLACSAAVVWALYASRKWELGPSLFFIVLTFYILCPGWSVQYYTWPAVFLVLYGMQGSLLYISFSAIVFLTYFLVVVFDLGALTHICACDIRNGLAIASLAVIAAAIPLWLKLYKNRGQITPEEGRSS